MHVKCVEHVTSAMSPAPFSLIIFFLSVLRVVRVMHVRRVMTPTHISPRIFGISVMRVLWVVHVMHVMIKHPFLHICLFWVLFMLFVLRVLYGLCDPPCTSYILRSECYACYACNACYAGY